MIRTCVVGAGYWGKNICRELGTDLVAVVDKDENLARDIGQTYGVMAFTEFRDAIESLQFEAVCIATPASDHYDTATISLNNGFNTFIEKPVTLSFDETKRLVDLAYEKNIIIMAGHSIEFSPGFAHVKEILWRAGIGDLYRADFVRAGFGAFRDVEHVMYSYAPHDISLACTIFGEAKTVKASGWSIPNKKLAVAEGKHVPMYDMVTLQIFYENGLEANIKVDWLSPIKTQRATIIGSEGMLVFDDVNKVVLQTDKSNRDGVKYYNQANDKLLNYGGDPPPLTVELHHFLECIQRQWLPNTGRENILNVHAVLEAASLSLLNDGARQDVRKF